MIKPLFVTIGVSKAATMPPLDGVLNGTKSLSAWAEANGYDVVTIDDRDSAVSIDRIRNELTPSDGNGGTVPDLLLDRQRIVIYFCGHGISSWPDQYWVLSAGPQFTRQRVSANAFRDTLATYGPRQIAVISDACRTAQHLIGAGDPVIDPHPGTSPPPQKDQFYSSRDGTSSFAVPPSNGQPAFCVFTNVLTKALSAPDDLNLDRHYLRDGRQVVTSRSLAGYLDVHVPRVALVAGQIQESQCDPGFRDNDDYIEFASVAPADPQALPQASFDLSPQTVRNPSTGAELTVVGDDLSTTLRSFESQKSRIEASRSEWRVPLTRAIQPQAERLSRDRPAATDLLLIASRSNDGRYFASTPPSDSFAAFDNALPGRWYAQKLMHGKRSGTVLVTSQDHFSAIPVFRNLWCAAAFQAPPGYGDEPGFRMVTWGNYDERDDTTGELDPSEAMKGLTNGTLVSSDLDLLAGRLRRGKHADPMLGIVAAYLYNSVGDTDNIRRMCHYYDRHDQDVPFDIAMLSGLPLIPDNRGVGFAIEVPHIAPTPRTRRGADAPHYTWEATPPTHVGVAGVLPVLRTGWVNLRNSPHDIHRAAWELIDDLTAAPIATFRGAETGKQLARILKLRG